MTRLLPFAAPPPRGKSDPAAAAFIVSPGRVREIPPNCCRGLSLPSRDHP